MKFKKCSCGKDLTSRDLKNIGRSDMGIWVNCKSCGTTLLIISKLDQEKFDELRRKETRKMHN